MKNSNTKWQAMMVAAIATIAFLFAAQTQVLAQKDDEPTLPKPDFSAMEKWYEIGDKIKTDVFAREMTIFVKAKKDENRPTRFKMQFIDEDGTVMSDPVLWNMFQFAAATPNEPIKVTIKTPSEYYLPKVKSLKVVRIVE